MIYYTGTTYFFNGPKNDHVGSGSVINWPPGSRSVRNISGSGTLFFTNGALSFLRVTVRQEHLTDG
jgi:hypothetical protein